jgi:hypothetical protein
MSAGPGDETDRSRPCGSHPVAKLVPDTPPTPSRCSVVCGLDVLRRAAASCGLGERARVPSTPPTPNVSEEGTSRFWREPACEQAGSGARVCLQAVCKRGGIDRDSRGRDSARSPDSSHRALAGQGQWPWAGGGGSWSAHFLGSVSFAACVCGMTNGPTSTRRSSRSVGADLLAVAAQDVGGPAERMPTSPAPIARSPFVVIASAPLPEARGPRDRSTLRRQAGVDIVRPTLPRVYSLRRGSYPRRSARPLRNHGSPSNLECPVPAGRCAPHALPSESRRCDRLKTLNGFGLGIE